MSELISNKTRLELREYFVGTTLSEISNEFDSADVPFDGEYSPVRTVRASSSNSENASRR